MKLDKIRIQDFRSIVDQEIVFSQNCIGLIGLNESGKSNILYAIRLLDSSFIPTIQDKSKITRKLPTVELTYDLDDEDLKKANEILQSWIKPIKILQTPQIKFTSNTKFKKIVRIIEAIDGLTKLLEFDIPLDYKFDQEILRKKSEARIPQEITVKIGDDEFPLFEISLIQKELVPPEQLNNFEVYSFEAFKRDFLPVLTSAFPKLSPQVIFWEYDRKYLLPSEIKYEEFIANENPYGNSAPLYNIFLLTKSLHIKDVEDLKVKIIQWKADSSERRRDGAILTDTINKYIKQIWSDYDQELKIELEETKITIHINDPKSDEQNYYAMEARSQGFKTFISFILTIAAEATNRVINNFVLLLDEPETHLHPSGVRYMKEELLKLSNDQNYIVFSTHSIFMIDRSNLKRHIMVQKVNEKTRLTKIEKNNFIQEAVIYEAMGTRIDDLSLGLKNIILEGSLDLKLLEFFIGFFSEEQLTPKGIKDYDLLDGGGTKQIKKFLESKILPRSSHWILLLDNDGPGRELEQYISKESKQFTDVKFTCHFYSRENNFELEDLLPREIIRSAFETSCQRLGLQDFANANFENTRAVSAIINEYLGRQNITKDNKSEFEEQFKTELDKATVALLDEVSKIQDIHEKFIRFNEIFPSYSQAISNWIVKVQK
ncbi:MAG TPA: AAA family ATPase [Puia sp.]|nr:AAA family ATPase [Puia sp.]